MSAPAPPPPMPPPAYGMPMMPPQPQSSLPVAGGALILIAGIMGIITWGWIMAAGATAASFLPIGGGFLTGLILLCGAIGIIFSLIALIGGFMGIQRKMWGLALAGGIFGILGVGLFGVGSLLSLIGLILVAISHGDFR